MEEPQERGRRTKRERMLIRAHLTHIISAERFRVRMARVGPKMLDSDNLAWGLKAFRDEISKCLGVRNDIDFKWGGRIEWVEPEQELTKEDSPFKYGLRVSIEPLR